MSNNYALNDLVYFKHRFTKKIEPGLIVKSINSESDFEIKRMSDNSRVNICNALNIEKIKLQGKNNE